MTTMRLLALAALVASSLWACGTAKESMYKLKSRASFDLDCAADLLVTKAVDSDTTAVTGCGKKAIYGYDAKGIRDWRRLSDIGPDKGPDSPEAPKNRPNSEPKF